MKTKINNKKLTLNRVTITKLSQEKMNAVNGGLWETEWCTRDFWVCNKSKLNMCAPTDLAIITEAN